MLTHVHATCGMGMMLVTLLLPSAALLVAVGTSASLAADFDGSQPLLCAGTELFSCVPDGGCERDTAEQLNAPRFVTIDIAARTISGKRPSGELLATKVDAFQQTDDNLILQGVDGPLTWSITIAKPTGTMALTADNDRSVIVVFGACTPR